MKTSDSGANMIQRFKGLKQTAYLDAVGVWTIGYGHTGYVKFFGKNVCAGMTITLAQAQELLRDDLTKFENLVMKFNPKYAWNQNEFDAMVSFALNIGNISGVTNNSTRTKTQIAVKIPEYNKGRVNGVLQPLSGLTKRREEEKALFITGAVNVEEQPRNVQIDYSVENTKIVQKWLNETYGNYIKKCKACGYDLLKVDGKNGNKTRSALTIAVQLYLNERNANLEIDGIFGEDTASVVERSILVKLGTTGEIQKIVQAILYVCGYNPQNFAGEFLGDSENALKEAQYNNRLLVDGKAGVVFFSTFLKQR
jgi:GH24 family phage-related lysozyme (muramidase)